jgi:hypothetical protein
MSLNAPKVGKGWTKVQSGHPGSHATSLVLCRPTISVRMLNGGTSSYSRLGPASTTKLLPRGARTDGLLPGGRREDVAACQDDTVLAACFDQPALELLAVEPGVEAVRGSELLVVPSLDDPAAVEHEDHVG